MSKRARLNKEDFPHDQVLQRGRERFPEESFQQLLEAGASEHEAMKMLGYSGRRSRRHR